MTVSGTSFSSTETVLFFALLPGHIVDVRSSNLQFSFVATAPVFMSIEERKGGLL